MFETAKRIGADVHAVTGWLGVLASFVVQHYNAFAAGLAATFTAGYMGFKMGRQYLKFRAELAAQEKEFTDTEVKRLEDLLKK